MSRKHVVVVWFHTAMSHLIRPRMRGETFRKWASRNMDNSRLATFVDVFQVVLGIGVTIIYFNQNWTKFQDVVETPALRNAQMTIGVLFTLDYIIRFAAAESRETFFFNTMSLVDLATILPQWLEMVISEDSDFKAQANALKTLRGLRFLRAFRLLVFAKTAKGRQAGILFLTVMSIIFCSAGIIQAIEACAKVGDTKCQDMEIYNAAYFVVITIATLGFGDLAPKTSNGKVAVIALIFSTGILLPLQISRYSDILSRETEFDKSFTARKEKNPHILICGEVNSGALDFFLRQFLHPNNFNWKDKVVILCPGLPSHNLRRILLNSAYEQRVVYLQGSAMLDSDLKRAGAANARLCFVMLNKLSQDGDRNDTASNLLTISLRHHTNDVPLFVQVLKTDNIRHIHMSGASNIICIDELKLGILAKACVIPGLCAFLCNMLFTFRPYYVRSTLWASEFLMGCAHDVYEAKLPDYLDGLLSFATLALILYQEYGILALAITGRNHLDMRLFPSKTILKRTHHIFLLATNPDAVNQVESLALPTLQKYEGRIANFLRVAERWHANSMAGKLRTTMRGSVASVAHPSMSIRSVESLRESATESVQDELPRRRSQLLNSYRSSFELLAKSADHSPSTRQDRSCVTRVIPYNEIDSDYMIDPDDSMVDKNDADDSPGECHPVEPSGGAPPLLESVQTVEPHTKQLLQKFSSHLLHVDGDAGVSTSGNVLSPATAANHADCFTSFLDQALPCSLSGHIILCGMPNALHDFIAPLRHQLDFHANSTQFLGSSQHAMTAAPIIVISQILLTEKQHASIAHFHQVYFICGSPLHEGVLRHASAYTAKSIVILGTCLQSKQRIDDDEGEAEAMAADTKDQNMLDTDAITLHRYIVEFCECNCPVGSPMTTVIVELSRPSSLRFLKDELVRAESPATLQAVKALTKRVLSRADDPLDNICHPIYAAGKVFISNSLDAVLGSCNKYGCIIDLLHLLTFGEGASNESGRMLDQIAVPLAYQDKSYLECFVQMLVTQDILCLGLFRARQDRHSYVFVNPSEDVRVQIQDRLFVLR
ncbi:hypothetical protein H310_11641 [Aphanomyces invadans]|uniref:BK channel n=1 Tax=Aphanomyces invadans TaxID=157072 RepID=A0A024TKT0_9STRA|nr:hypothetical protein H310_11641 [Aphanomyces invadans]ETV94653.1 hypothetical protein H310_11641 [Aphanomyces invadans]|eukprot:XP_008876598.1 hypothetical protein H310_11641 [Aphanomyces invadans]